MSFIATRLLVARGCALTLVYECPTGPLCRWDTLTDLLPIDRPSDPGTDVGLVGWFLYGPVHGAGLLTWVMG